MALNCERLPSSHAFTLYAACFHSGQYFDGYRNGNIYLVKKSPVRVKLMTSEIFQSIPTVSVGKIS